MRNAHWSEPALCGPQEREANEPSKHVFFPQSRRMEHSGQQTVCTHFFIQAQDNEKSTASQTLWLAAVGSHHQLYCLVDPPEKEQMGMEPPSCHLFLPPKVMPSSSLKWESLTSTQQWWGQYRITYIYSQSPSFVPTWLLWKINCGRGQK